MVWHAFSVPRSLCACRLIAICRMFHTTMILAPHCSACFSMTIGSTPALISSGRHHPRSGATGQATTHSRQAPIGKWKPEIGSGWGGLGMYLAEAADVDVTG